MLLRPTYLFLWFHFEGFKAHIPFPIVIRFSNPNSGIKCTVIISQKKKNCIGYMLFIFLTNGNSLKINNCTPDQTMQIRLRSYCILLQCICQNISLFRKILSLSEGSFLNSISIPSRLKDMGLVLLCFSLLSMFIYCTIT